MNETLITKTEKKVQEKKESKYIIPDNIEAMPTVIRVLAKINDNIYGVIDKFLDSTQTDGKVIPQIINQLEFEIEDKETGYTVKLTVQRTKSKKAKYSKNNIRELFKQVFVALYNKEQPFRAYCLRGYRRETMDNTFITDAKRLTKVHYDYHEFDDVEFDLSNRIEELEFKNITTDDKYPKLFKTQI